MLGACKTKVKIKDVIDQNKGDMILWNWWMHSETGVRLKCMLHLI